MRIILKTTASTFPVPFDYQAKMVGCLHKWIGTRNELHGKISLYSFSWLQDGVVMKSALSFPRGARFFISFYDESVVKDIIRTILDDPDMFCGMEIRDITLAPVPDFSKVTCTIVAALFLSSGKWRMAASSNSILMMPKPANT